jgi:hypothetical protein
MVGIAALAMNSAPLRAAHRIPVEEVKPEKERSSYLYPDTHGQAAEKGVLWALFPELNEHVAGPVRH